MSVSNARPNLPHSAEPPHALDATLRAAARRIRWLRLLRIESRALFVSAAACLIYVGLSKLRLLPEADPALYGGLIGVALFFGLLLALLRPLNTLDVARLTERRADLKERLSSAVEFRAQGIDPSAPFYGEQYADAERHAAEVDLNAAYPVRVPRELFGGLIAALALFLLFFLPTLPAFWPAKQKEEMAEVKKQGIQIVRLAQDTQKKAEQQKLDETKKAATEARKLGEAMRKGRLNKKQSLIEMQKLTRKMEEAQKRLAANMPKKSMEQAHSEFKRSLDQMQKEVAQAQKQDAQKRAQQQQQANKAQKNGQKNAPKPPQQQQESQAMKQARAAMQQMAQALADQDNKQMQQSMEKLAQQMESGKVSKEEMQQLQKALQQLAQALKNTNMDMSAKQMEQLAQMMQGMGNIDPNTLQQMAAMMRGIGKGMGKGMGSMQAELDMKMLAELAEAMKSGRMLMAMGSIPGSGGKMPGHGINGSGIPSTPMKDPGKTNPRLLALGKNSFGKGIGKSGSAKEFAKYLAMGAKSSKVLPNGKIAGMRSQNGNELQTSMTGDPEPARSNAPYYQVYRTSKRAAESTLDKESIPAAYKRQVRDYFDSIKP
jgi:hypothetical protein